MQIYKLLGGGGESRTPGGDDANRSLAPADNRPQLVGSGQRPVLTLVSIDTCKRLGA